MFDSHHEIEVYISKNLGCFFTLFFGIKRVGDCTIPNAQSELNDGDCFPLFEMLGIAL